MTKCIEWRGPIDKEGYGKIYIGGQWRRAHRVAYTLFVGNLDSPDECVCHKCDNRKCIRPSHLFLGTRTENNRDMVRKGRQVRGETHGMSRLSRADALEIRSSKRPIKYLIEKFGVSRSHILSIKKGKRWSL